VGYRSREGGDRRIEEPAPIFPCYDFLFVYQIPTPTNEIKTTNTIAAIAIPLN